MTTPLRFVGQGPIPGARVHPDPLKDPAGYRAGDDLVRAVEVALALGMPLLVTGDPGTGKTQLAYRMAAEFGIDEVLRFDTKSSSQAPELFYQFDAIRRFAQAQLDATAGREPMPARQFVRWQALGTAILRTRDAAWMRSKLGSAEGHVGPTRSVVLIDEIDKAPRDFPNDLLNQIENREFYVPELDQTFDADPAFAPVVVITSNSEKQLPEAFLRRCVYHHIEFPKDHGELQQILGARLQRLTLPTKVQQDAVNLFFAVREDKRFSRAPSTSELLDWLRALAIAKIDPDRPLRQQPAALSAAASALFKTREDLEHARSLAT